MEAVESKTADARPGAAEYPIEVRGISKSYGRRQVLREIGFRVGRGQTLVIMGGSGQGKSTLLKILIGALRPDAGQIVIEGVDVTRLAPRALDEVRRRFGVLFQGGALLNSLTIAENIALPIRYHGNLIESEIREHVKIKLAQAFPPPEDGGDDRAHRWAEYLKAMLGRLPGTLSGGERKRVALARALALDPRILFYDEPTSGLDPMTTDEIGAMINLMKAKMRITSIVVTHDVRSAMQIADAILILDDGAVLEQGTPEQIRASTHPRVKDFVEGRGAARPERRNVHERFWRDLLEL